MTLSAAQSTTQPAISELSAPTQTLFTEDQGHYHNYRIPSLIVTKAGTVLAFCEGRMNPTGPTNDSGEINLLLRRSTDGGKTFSEAQVIWADDKNTCGNPCPVIDQSTGKIILVGSHNYGDDREGMINDKSGKGTRTAWLLTSDDDGVTWSKPLDITASVKKPDATWFASGPGVGIQLQRGPHAGRLIIPCDYGLGKGGGPGNAYVIYSDDHGKTWKIGGEPTNHAYNESQVVELSDGSVMLNMRSTGKIKSDSARGVAISTDGGETFGEGKADSVLIEPHCQGAIIRYDFGKDADRGVILFSNPASSTERKFMTVRVSDDDGKTWPHARLIHAGWSCYSSLCRLPDGQIGLFYEAGDEHRYQRLDFLHVPLSDLIGAESSPKPQ